MLVAYNLWLAEPDLATARRVAAELRGPDLRTLGLALGPSGPVAEPPGAGLEGPGTQPGYGP